MEKLNCWTFKKCGLEPGGSNISKYGVCPAAVEESLDEINSGENASRVCWAIKNTICDSMKLDNYAKKIRKCLEYSFYKLVKMQGKKTFQGIEIILHKNWFLYPFIKIENYDVSSGKHVVFVIHEENRLCGCSFYRYGNIGIAE